MKIILTSVFVNDQGKALRFYTGVLGFVKKQDVSMGKYRWLTVVSPDQPDGTELLLEPDDNPAAKTYQKAIFGQGIPATMFGVGNIQEEYQRLKALGVVFTVEPTQVMGSVWRAVLDDTCGNLIQIVQK
jgi:predicted enzyme related to lactoylglutathione lyase